MPKKAFIKIHQLKKKKKPKLVDKNLQPIVTLQFEWHKMVHNLIDEKWERKIKKGN